MIDAVIDDLRASLGDRVSTATAVRDEHGRDEGWHPPAAPDAVAFPMTTEEVVAIVRACATRRVPLVPYGAGTSLEGNVTALHGGVTVDLSRMDRVLEVNVDDLDCRVEAGVTRSSLNRVLARDGLFFPIDPGADATLGGMAATRASGTNAVRYGTMKDNVLGLTAVLADGSVVRTGTRARKSSAGYDLTRLLVGSEGTLGVITEVALRLYGVPEVIGGAVCSFATLAGAVRAVIEAVQLGVPVARLELLDEVQVDACNRHSGLALPVEPLLLVEFHGSPVTVADHAAAFEAVASAHGGSGWEWTTDAGARERLWAARHHAYYAAKALRPGALAIPTDVCVPISRLADCIVETRTDIDRTGLLAPIVGHVGDGNFHVVVLFDPSNDDEVAAAHALNARLIARAQAMGGTCTGEHGVGYGKLEFMAGEHGTGALAMMAAVKRALDPDGILNPGKVVPAMAG
ncbi:MAG TPA: FAD-linked oxidase C-terminal domain-containing protein [Acidimicrobiales bacterium]|nr:FAD-linked oxidase C-terminal domain-containing protein [Acidimicrobiales bacterium]